MNEQMEIVDQSILVLIERGWQPYSTLAYRDQYLNFKSKDGSRFAYNVYHPKDIPMIVEATTEDGGLGGE